MRMTDRYNRIIYALWSPVYDSVLDLFFRKGRRRAMAVADLQPGERVLLPGIGTGADLPLLPPGVSAVGLDLSEAMLSRACRKLPLPGREVVLQAGDAQALPMEDGTFDVLLMNLILSVVPNPRKCMGEALRALRPSGRIVIFDKFLPDGTRPAFRRRLANLGATMLGTDINRRLGDILRGQPCDVVQEEPSLMGGMYRVVLLRKTERAAGDR
jgi:phosphatidylethanolamine/phosphatidyl-N-methylethanolamine N-methyltransferase